MMTFIRKILKKDLSKENTDTTIVLTKAPQVDPDEGDNEEYDEDEDLAEEK